MSDTTPTLLASREAREVVARQMAYQHITDHPDAWVDMSEQRRDGWRARAQSVIDALFASGVVQEPAEFVAGLAAGMTKRREELWTAYLTSPGGHIETLRQGKLDGFAEAQAMIAAALGATR